MTAIQRCSVGDAERRVQSAADGRWTCHQCHVQNVQNHRGWKIEDRRSKTEDRRQKAEMQLAPIRCRYADANADANADADAVGLSYAIAARHYCSHTLKFRS